MVNDNEKVADSRRAQVRETLRLAMLWTVGRADNLFEEVAAYLGIPVESPPNPNDVQRVADHLLSDAAPVGEPPIAFGRKLNDWPIAKDFLRHTEAEAREAIAKLSFLADESAVIPLYASPTAHASGTTEGEWPVARVRYNPVAHKYEILPDTPSETREGHLAREYAKCAVCPEPATMFVVEYGQPRCAAHFHSPPAPPPSANAGSEGQKVVLHVETSASRGPFPFDRSAGGQR